MWVIIRLTLFPISLISSRDGIFYLLLKIVIPALNKYAWQLRHESIFVDQVSSHFCYLPGEERGI